MGETTSATIRSGRAAQVLVAIAAVALVGLTTATATVALSAAPGSGGAAVADEAGDAGPTPPTTTPPVEAPVEPPVGEEQVAPAVARPGGGATVTATLQRLDTPVVAGTPTLALDDIAYGPLPDQVLDVYESPNGAPTGAIVYVHGGAWIGGDEDLTSSPFPQLIRDLAANEGWTVFSIRYRLAADPSVPGDTGAPFPAALLDVNRAVRWVKANATEFSIDPDRLIVYGWSAGGHLATMLATTWNEPSLQPTELPASLAAVSPRPTGVVSLAAPLDPLAWGDSNPDPANIFSPGAAIASFAGCAADTYASCSAADVRRLDATAAADAADPPVYLGHGDQDGIVFPLPQQAAVMRLAAALGADRVTYDVTSAGPADHRNHVPDMGLDGDALRTFLHTNG